MRGGNEHLPLIRAQFTQGALHVGLPDNDDPKDEVKYVMSIQGDHAALIPDDPTDGYSLPLERTASGAKPSTDWEPNRAYSVNDSPASCAEMKTIFDEDQRVRAVAHIDWDAVNKTDAERQKQTRKLLVDGVLHTGEDYEWASFIFQHGHTSDDYLLAHTLAMVAVSKGDATAVWIAAATLDRYLETIGQKQIFGTQFTGGSDHKFSQEPYSRDLISDALRRQLGVLSQANQAEELKAIQLLKP
jgi:hypothetical protein